MVVTCTNPLQTCTAAQAVTAACTWEHRVAICLTFDYPVKKWDVTVLVQVPKQVLHSLPESKNGQGKAVDMNMTKIPVLSQARYVLTALK